MALLASAPLRLSAGDAIPPPTAVAHTADNVGEDLYLEVSLNGNPTGQLLHLMRSGPSLCAAASDLRRLGFTLAGSRSPLPCLGDLPGVQYQYDVARQRLEITGDTRALQLPTTRYDPTARAPASTSGNRGVLLNYDVYASRAGGLSNLSAAAELRAFTPGGGVLSHSMLARAYQMPGGRWQHDSVRLDSQWRLAFPEQTLALEVGDSVTQALSWTRATHLGGVTFGRDFALQPYQVTTPLPQFFGQATVPSSVELYINGIRQYGTQVPAGPFQLTSAPGVTAGGQAQVVLTDALGRASTLSFPFYTANQLLRDGLSDWSVSLGRLRENYGLRSFDYGQDWLGSATWRRGLSDNLTVEAHAESGHGNRVTGVGANWIPFDTGLLNGSIARSRGGGSQFGLGYSWIGRVLNFALDSLRSFGRYRDIASGYGAPVARISERALAGLNLGRSNLGVNYVRLRYPGQPASRYAGAYWLQVLGNGTSLNASYTQNLDNARDRSFFLGLSMLLDDSRNLSMTAQRDAGRSFVSADLSQPVNGDGGFGWRVQGRGGDDRGGQAELDWLGNQGELRAGVSQFGPSSYGYAEGLGSLALIGGHLLSARRIDDAFALVSTEGMAGVPVMLENRPIGVTDHDGLLLVPRLAAYQDNRLAIDPMGLPADAQVTRVEATVAPTDRAGVIVRFPVSKVRAALLILVDGQGQPLPLGSVVQGAGPDAPVGYDGQVYLDQLAASHTDLTVRLPDGTRCQVSFDYPAQVTRLPQLGPLTCRSQA